MTDRMVFAALCGSSRKAKVTRIVTGDETEALPDPGKDSVLGDSLPISTFGSAYPRRCQSRSFTFRVPLVAGSRSRRGYDDWQRKSLGRVLININRPRRPETAGQPYSWNSSSCPIADIGPFRRHHET